MRNHIILKIIIKVAQSHNFRNHRDRCVQITDRVSLARSRPNFPRKTSGCGAGYAWVQTQVKNDRSASAVCILTDPEGVACDFWPNRLDFAWISTHQAWVACDFWPNKLDFASILTDPEGVASDFWPNMLDFVWILTDLEEVACHF